MNRPVRAAAPWRRWLVVPAIAACLAAGSCGGGGSGDEDAPTVVALGPEPAPAPPDDPAPPDEPAPAPPDGGEPAPPEPDPGPPQPEPPQPPSPPSPVPATLPLALGATHTCGMRDGAVWCWGSHRFGQLGHGAATGFGRLSTSAVRVVDTQDSPLQGIRAIAAGGSHSCAITDARRVVCWGRNHRGQLGTGRTVPSARAVAAVGVEGAVALALGTHHSCALTQAGAVHCWGDNREGQVTGAPGSAPQPAPVVVGLPRGASVQAVAAGQVHSCVRIRAGGVYCWGGNDFRQLGFSTGNDDTSRRPGRVEGLAQAGHLVLGGRASCSVNADERVPRCWGKSPTLGDGTGVTEIGVGPRRSDLSLRDRLRDAEAVTGLAPGLDFACALTSMGSTLCMGTMAHGELGVGAVGPQDPDAPPVLYAPVVAAVPDSKALAAAVAGSHACAVTLADDVFCWGEGGDGQLGNGASGAGATTGVPTPVTVFSLK